MADNWESPLKPGQRVCTEDGYVVEIKRPPRESGDGGYHVKVVVVLAPRGFKHLEGKSSLWQHIAPLVFLKSRIVSIDGNLDRSLSLEEEYFSRSTGKRSCRPPHSSGSPTT